jgi:hypothetical protein
MLFNLLPKIAKTHAVLTKSPFADRLLIQSPFSIRWYSIVSESIFKRSANVRINI